ncbi:MAG: TetR/AcrR family transcriptional regulator C-terminal domain-containing protein [Lachnospiraceae bacterium]
MKREEIVLNTKKALAASLKKLLLQKPISKITVTEIIEDCNVNRKTFYYHFEDIYALLTWMLEQEAFDIAKKFDPETEFEDCISFAMDYVDSNKHLLNCIYNSIGHDELKRFLYNDFVGIMGSKINQMEASMNLHIDENARRFMTEFYTNAVAGTLIGWFKDRNAMDKQQTIDYIVTIFQVSLPQVLAHYSKP